MTEITTSVANANNVLHVHGVNYQYRHCDGCRSEWPAQTTHCLKCLRWLGDSPQERIEWQLVPSQGVQSTPASYEFICASALCLRVVGQQPNEQELQDILDLLTSMLITGDGHAVRAVASRGWLVWTTHGARRAFLSAIGLRDRLIASLPALKKTLPAAARLRWGIWVDTYVLPCNAKNEPIIGEAVGAAILDFEPDGLLLVSESIFQASRRWEQFVCIPVRRLSGTIGYRFLGHKRPSAVDHARTTEQSRFVGRRDTLRRLDSLSKASRKGAQKAVIVAPAGSGKTRLVNEWLNRRPEVRALRANCSIFGGDVASFSGQLAELPEYTVDIPTLVARTHDRIRQERIGILILDDLHWIDEPTFEYLARLLASLSTCRILILLCTRPSGRALAPKLGVSTELRLRPLAPGATANLAGNLCRSPRLATLAARLARGNPLFVEQFAAWSAETHYTGRGPCPKNLHQVIAARIRHLQDVRLRDLRLWVSCRGIPAPYDLNRELDDIESEIGLWLDRLETGDYADRVEVARYLISLERVEFDLFLASTLAGRPRSRSNRLSEAIERLLLGSADPILQDMEARALVKPKDADDLNLQREAVKFGECAAADYRWDLAVRFYKLAIKVASRRNQEELRKRLDEFARYLNAARGPEPTVDSSRILEELENRPAVDSLRLPGVWLKLGQRFLSRRYYLRAAEAADLVNDRANGELARRRSASERFA